jgi:hypothetical protein
MLSNTIRLLQEKDCILMKYLWLKLTLTLLLKTMENLYDCLINFTNNLKVKTQELYLILTD